MTKRIIMTSGLALFAMFFGAGNIIYPLELGTHAGDHIFYILAAFLISGIGLPFLGLFAISLYHGDYWAFFKRLGKVPGFILITFLILFIGPFFAAPRTETVAYHTLEPFLSGAISNSYVFSALYCFILFLMTYSHTKVVDIIGRFLSPIKLGLFTLLILLGIATANNISDNPNTIAESVHLGLIDGYSTMDLLAAFFFCAVVYKSITAKAKLIGITQPKELIRIFFYSCVVGAGLLGVVYIGFMLLALSHASALQNVPTAQLITAVSHLVLGKFGSIFVGICVSFACLVTAIALTEVTTSFFYEHVFNHRVPRTLCLIGTIIMIFCMSNLGFAAIMTIALPILKVLYPALIIYCIYSIFLKLYSDNKIEQSPELAEEVV